MAAEHEHVAKMLANPMRARILRQLLATETVSVTTLRNLFPGRKREVFGHHMRLMRSAGVIEIARDSRPRRRTRPGRDPHEYRLAVERNVLRGLLWGQKATIVSDGGGKDGASVLDSRGLEDLAALMASFTAALSQIEREADERRKAAGDQADGAWAVAVLVAKDVALF